MMGVYHRGVLVDEMVSFLRPRSGGVYIDATLGGGDWTAAILEASKPDGIVIGCDRDGDAIDEAAKRFSDIVGKRLLLMNTNFRQMASRVKEMGMSAVDGIVADLGVSSHQLELPERGFSFQTDGKLDMRMDARSKLSAFDIVNTSSAEELERYIREFGEERYSRRIARAVIIARKNKPIKTTRELAEIIVSAVPPHARRTKIHPATRTFQAIRIVVNEELGELDALLTSAPILLKDRGRFVIASYHSLEDRMVKRKFRELEKGGGFLRIVKRPVVPKTSEVLSNRRARSAKMRVIERILNYA